MLVFKCSIICFYNNLENDKSSYVKDKLDDALQRKVDEIEVRRQAEEAEKFRLENMTKQQKEKHKYKNIGKLDPNSQKKNKKSLIQEERDIHEAYQLLLSEYHKRVKQRTKKKIATVAALMKNTTMSTTPPTNGNRNLAGVSNIFGATPKTSESKPGKVLS